MPALPNRLDPFRLARSNTTLRGRVALTALPRVADAALVAHRPADAAVDATLTFGVTTNGEHRVDGNLSSVLELVCQRCLAPVTYPIEIDVALVIVNGASSGGPEPAETESLETWEVTDDTASLHELIEDELLLALPLMPAHPQGVCATPLAASDEETGEAPRTESPFAGLKDALRSPGC